MARILCNLLAVWAFQGVATTPNQEITPAGKYLGKVLDAMNVEELWLAGKYVNWKTGRPLDKQVTDGKAHTHCSAFVAAACAKLDIYILRPPEHSSVMLANAQYDWLHDQGPMKGWKPVTTALEAQRLANQGFPVVAAYKEGNGKRPGHMAIVRPATKSEAQINDEGPQIIQAGKTNYTSTSLREGFKNHPAAWSERRVHFFAHEVRAK